MVLLTITPTMFEALEILHQSELALNPSDGSADPVLDQAQAGDPISHGQVIELADKLSSLRGTVSKGSQTDGRSFQLESLLRGSRVYVAAPKPKAEPSSDYKRLMARLRREEEARAYDRMTHPPPRMESFQQRFPSAKQAHLFPTSAADQGDEDEVSFSDINRQVAVIFNVLVTIVACSAGLWIAARHWSTPSRLGLSMGGSTLIGAAEVVVYAGYLRRVKEAKEKAKKEVEVKEVMQTWVVGGKEKDASMAHVLPVSAAKEMDHDLRKRKSIKTEG